MRREPAERTAAGERASDASQSSEELVSEASHALKGPLQTILGIADLLQEGAYGSLSPEQADAVRRLVAGSESLERRLETVVGLVQAGTLGSRGFGPEAVAPHLPVGSAVRRISRQVAGRGLSLSAEVPEDHPPVRGPGTYLLRLFETVLRFVLPEGGGTGQDAVVIRSWPPEDGEARLGVLSGAVALEEESPGAWLPAREERAGGPGRSPTPMTLELYVARRMVEAHGGRILVGSPDREGRPCVYLSLPLSGDRARDGGWRETGR